MARKNPKSKWRVASDNEDWTDRDTLSCSMVLLQGLPRIEHRADMFRTAIHADAGRSSVRRSPTGRKWISWTSFQPYLRNTILFAKELIYFWSQAMEQVLIVETALSYSCAVSSRLLTTDS
jgi:hypothetical protein